MRHCSSSARAALTVLNVSTSMSGDMWQTACKAAEFCGVPMDWEGCWSLLDAGMAWTSAPYFCLLLTDVSNEFTVVLCGQANNNPVLCGKINVFYRNKRVISKLWKHQGERILTSQILKNTGTDFISDTCEILLLLIQSCNYNRLGISILLKGNRRIKSAFLQPTQPELAGIKENSTFF